LGREEEPKPGPKPKPKTTTKRKAPAVKKPKWSERQWYGPLGDMREYPLFLEAQLEAKLKGVRFTYPDGWKELFLERLRFHLGNVSAAARDLGITPHGIRKHRKDDEDFAMAWDTLREGVIEDLEEAGLRRAMAGDQQLIRFFLGAYKPARFQPAKRLEVTGKDGGPVLQGVVILPDNGREPQLEAGATTEERAAFYRMKLEELEAEVVDVEVIEVIDE
jgi:hypothetical protein